MLAVLVTGIVIHHRIFKDFFTFRPEASFHRSWLDAHNATGVLILPFHFVITFTGLVIFWMIYMPAGVDLFYGGDFDKMLQEVEQRVHPQRAGIPAPLISLAALEQQAKTYWGGGVTEEIHVRHPGDLHAQVEVVRRADDRVDLISDRVTFDGATGKVLNVWKGKGSAFVTYSVLLGLHYLWFDHAMIRWLYFFMGLTGSIMIASGLLLWVIKRKDRHAWDAVGYQIVESLNVAVVAGLPVAIAAFFWANRLWPLNVPERAMWEMNTFFFLWALCVAHGFLRKGCLWAWKEQVGAAAALFALLPLLNVGTTGDHLLVSLPVGNWRLAGIDLTCLGVGGSCTGLHGVSGVLPCPSRTRHQPRSLKQVRNEGGGNRTVLQRLAGTVLGDAQALSTTFLPYAYGRLSVGFQNRRLVGGGRFILLRSRFKRLVLWSDRMGRDDRCDRTGADFPMAVPAPSGDDPRRLCPSDGFGRQSELISNPRAITPTVSKSPWSLGAGFHLAGGARQPHGALL